MMDVPKDDGKATNGSKRKTSVAVEKPSKSLKNDKGKWIVPPLTAELDAALAKKFFDLSISSMLDYSKDKNRT